MREWVTIYYGDFEATIDIAVATGMKRGLDPISRYSAFVPLTAPAWAKLMKLMVSDPFERNAAAIRDLPDLLQDTLATAEEELKMAIKVYSDCWKDPEYYYNHGGDRKKKAEIKRSNAELKSTVAKAKTNKERVERMIRVFRETVEERN